MNTIVKCIALCAPIGAALSGCGGNMETAAEPEAVCIQAGACGPVAVPDGAGGVRLVTQWVPVEGELCVPPADVRYYATPESCGN